MIRNIWYHCTSWFLESHFFSLTTHASASWQRHHHLWNWKAKRIGGRLLLVDSTSHSIRLLLSHQLFYCRLPICEVTSETSRATDQIGCKAIVFAGVQIEEITDRTSNIDAWAKDIENRAGQRPSNACRHRLQRNKKIHMLMYQDDNQMQLRPYIHHSTSVFTGLCALWENI